MTLFALLLAVPLVIMFLLCIPFDYIKYRSSPYFKNFKEKYSIGITGSINFMLYNAIEQLNLPVKFYKIDSGGLIAYAIYGDIVIIGDVVLSFDDEHGFYISGWVEEDDTERETFDTLEETAAQYLASANELAGGAACHRAVYFLKEENLPDVDDSQYEILLSRGDVILYSDETLKQNFIDFVRKENKEAL